nr:DUF882 domain-containing protein [uncultured Cohaesibacter sp.]
MLGLFLPLLLLCILTGTQAHADTRTLRLSNAHTKESATITYKRNGKFDADGLRKLNQFLRDWRRNEKTEMDPALFDLIWEVYNKTGASQPITVFSGYRSPATNNMLRDKSSGVAKNSRHTMGQAMDFYLPGVPLATIRRVGLQMQAGGVGYYPGSRFIHIDTGNVRHWPRMTRKQLAQVFPDGVTVHIPTDGKPLSGYQTAKAKVAKRKAEMARSTHSVQRFTQYASAAPSEPKKLTRTQVASLSKQDEEKSGGLLQTLLRQKPKEPPKPQFTEAETENGSDPEAEADELLEEGASAQALLLPESLGTLPKVRMVQSTRITLAANDQAPANPTAAPTEATASEPQPAEPGTPTGQLAQGDDPTATAPLVFASMPRIRPDNLVATSYQLASATTSPIPAVKPEQVGSAPTENLVQMASLPRARASAGPLGQAAQITGSATRQPQPASQAQPQNTRQMLAQMVGSREDASPNRFAYASAGNTFVASLPSDSQRSNAAAAGGQAAPRQQLASLSNDISMSGLPEPRAGAILRQSSGQSSGQSAGETSDSDVDSQLDQLTFAYGPSGMAHFAHMKQRASTATFARLSRPTPNNLSALVYKPHSMINQGFEPLLDQRLDAMHFEGPAIARLAVKRFN